MILKLFITVPVKFSLSEGGELSLSDPDAKEIPLADNSPQDNCKTKHSLSNLYRQKNNQLLFSPLTFVTDILFNSKT